MDFAISAKMNEILPKMAQFVKSELMPLEQRLLHEPFRSLLPDLQQKRERVKSLGLWLPQMPTKVGGMGLSLLEHGLVSEVIGQSPLGHYVFNCQAPDAGNMEILYEFGTAEQKQKYLTPLCEGKIRSCFSMTEPECAGSNPVIMLTQARKEGDNYVIDGHKWFTSSADGSTFAIVMAITNPNAEPHQRASQIIVPMDTPGVELTRNVPIMGEAGEDYMSHAEMFYRNVVVPQSNLLGREGAGFEIAQHRLGPGRIHHCMRWLGICQRAFELMCRRAAERELSPGKSLGTMQIVQSWIAEAKASIAAARWLVLHAAWKIDNLGATAARDDISMIKFFCSDVLMGVVDKAIQVHGALGITEDTILSFYYRHERGARIYDGPDEVHKMVLARSLLKPYGIKVG